MAYTDASNQRWHFDDAVNYRYLENLMNVHMYR
jgi:hypothetical protein